MSDSNVFPYVVKDNNVPYKLFALKSQMWPILEPGEQVTFRTIDMDGAMKTVANIARGGRLLALDESRKTYIQTFIDNFFESGTNECLVYVSDDARVLTWPFPDQVKVRFERGYLFADLSEIADYKTVYENINIGIFASLESS